MARARAGRRAAVIDTHAHWWPRECLALLGEPGAGAGARAGRLFEARAGSPGSDTASGEASPLRAESPEALLERMKRRRVDTCLFSLSHAAAYAGEPDAGLRLARAWNDACSALHVERPERFIGAIHLPMQAPDLAVRELRRAARLPGMRAVCLGTHVNGRSLDEEVFWPVFAGCETLRLPVVLHPHGPMAPERTSRELIGNLCGAPYQTGTAAASLVAGGVLDAFPDLRVLLPQAGGVFPWLAGRLNRARDSSRELRQLKHRPATYLRRFYYDTGSHEPRIVRCLMDLVGADRVVLGNDCWLDSERDRPAAVLERMPGLAERERSLLLAGNARRLLRL